MKPRISSKTASCVIGVGLMVALVASSSPGRAAARGHVRGTAGAAAAVGRAAPQDTAGAPCCGVHAYEVDGVDVALMSVERTDPKDITVRWQYRNETADPKKLGQSFRGMGSSEAFSLVWDAYVVDPVARMKYPILKDTRGTPVGASHPGRKVVVLDGKGTKTVWAKFPVPATTARLSVYLPGAEPFDDVAVTEPARR